MDKVKIPIVKKDAVVNVEVSYEDCGWLANGLVLLAQKFTPEEMEEFKTLLDAKQPLTKILMATYVSLDRLYRKFMSSAQEQDKVDIIEVDPVSASIPESIPHNPE